MADKPLSATLVIATKNRKEDLRRALTSAVGQSIPLRVIVIDDCSSDGTPDMVVQEFPTVQLQKNTTSTGYIAARNLGARISSSDIIFSIDDDAMFSTELVVEQTLSDFEEPLVGAVAIPFVDVNYGTQVHQISRSKSEINVSAGFRGTAYAVRREIFNRLGGFREILFHQCEEGDFCIRMMDAGYFVRLGRSDPIHHFESPRRDSARVIVFNARNNVLYAWQNVPMPWMPVHLLGTTFNLIRSGVKRRHILWTAKGLWAGYREIAIRRNLRDPVARATYRLSRQLKHGTPLTLDSVAKRN